MTKILTLFMTMKVWHERMNAEDGMFTDRGYVAYKGFFRMEEVMNGSQSSRMEMGGLSR